jgi:hypothetical protein
MARPEVLFVLRHALPCSLAKVVGSFELTPNQTHDYTRLYTMFYRLWLLDT